MMEYENGPDDDEMIIAVEPNLNQGEHLLVLVIHDDMDGQISPERQGQNPNVGPKLVIVMKLRKTLTDIGQIPIL